MSPIKDVPITFVFRKNLTRLILAGTAGKPDQIALHVTDVLCIKCGKPIPATPGVNVALLRAGLTAVKMRGDAIELAFDRQGTIFTDRCPHCGLGSVVIHAEPGQAPVGEAKV